MNLEIVLPACQRGCIFPLTGSDSPTWEPDIKSARPPKGIIPAGTEIVDTKSTPLFQVIGSVWLPASAHGVMSKRYPLVRALVDIQPTHYPASLATRKNGYSLAVITLSDKGSQGLRRDESGPLLTSLTCEALPICFCQNFLLPDEVDELRALTAELALDQKYDLIFTTGGTGLAERDITPQALKPLINVELQGFTAAMLAESLKHTPNAVISRALAGLAGKCLVITFPGSVKAVRENLAAILPALPHALKKIHGDMTDCGV